MGCGVVVWLDLGHRFHVYVKYIGIAMGYHDIWPWLSMLSGTACLWRLTTIRDAICLRRTRWSFFLEFGELFLFRALKRSGGSARRLATRSTSDCGDMQLCGFHRLFKRSDYSELDHGWKVCKLSQRPVSQRRQANKHPVLYYIIYMLGGALTCA